MSSAVPDSRVERVFAYFFGRDVFVSYCYKDSAYAEALAVGLGERKFSVFLGAWGASPGRKISERVTSAARQSRLLVVVATPQSRASGPVGEEIGYFAARGRPVVPIDFGLGMTNPKEEWPAISGTDVIRETADLPSAPVLDRIDNAAKFMRQETRLRRFLGGIGIAVTALILGALLWSFRIVEDAEKRVGDAQTREQDAVKRAGEAQLAATRADGEKKKAEADREIARTEKEEADRLQQQAATSAQRESEIALALRLANDATTVARQQPTLIADASLMAVDSVRRLHRHGLRALAADNAIRATAGVLPIVDHRMPFAVRIGGGLPTSTPDARFVVGWRNGDTARIEIVDTRSGVSTPLSLPPDAKVVNNVVISADGSRTAATYRRQVDGPGGALVIWQTAGSAVIREIPVQEGVLAFALDRGGETLALTERIGQDVSTRIVRVVDGVELARIPRPADTLERSLTFSPSGKILAILGPSTIVWPWTEGPTTLKPRSALAPQQLFFHPTDEEFIAFQSPGLQIWRWRAWRVNDSPAWSTPADVSADRGGAAFSSDGEWIAASARSSVVVAHWRETRNPTTIPLHGESRVVAVENGKVAIGFRDGVAELWSMAEDTATHVAHDGEVLAVAFTPGGAVHSVSESGAMTWRAAPVDSRLTTARVDDAAISRDGAIIVTVVSDALQSRNHKLYVYRDGRELGPFTGGKFSSVAFDADGGLLAGTKDDRLLRWKSVADLEAGKPPDVLAEVRPSVSISPSGAYQAWITPAVRRKTASGRAEIVSSVVVSGPKGLRFELPHSVPAGMVVFGSDDMLVTAAGDGKIRVWKWRVDARRPAAVFTRRGTSFLAVSRDGAWVAAIGREGPALIWSTSGPDRPVAAFPSGMSMIGFDPSAACLLTADADGIARVWSPWRDAPVEIARFTALPAVDVARFSADGRYLVTASRFDGVRRRLWNDDEIADVACQRLRNAGLARYGEVCSGGPQPAVVTDTP